MSTFKAQLDDIMLEVEYVDDIGEHAFAEFELVDTNGSQFESTGNRARTFPFHTWFKNDSYNDYTRFKEIIEQRDVIHNLVHPEEGLIFGIITGYQIRHDDKKKAVEADFIFTEQLHGDFESQLSPLIQPKIEEYFTSGQTQAIDRFKARILLALGPGASSLVSRTLSSAQSFASQFVDAAAAVRSFVGTVDTAVNGIVDFLSDIEQPANSLIASINYGTSLPGMIIGHIASALDRALSLSVLTVESPALTLQSFYNGVQQLRNAAIGFEQEVDNIVAQTGALLASQLFKNDNDARGEAELIENTVAWNETGLYVGKADAPQYMTVEETERSLVTVRTWLQTAYIADREMTILQQMAAELLDHVNRIKINRSRTYTINIPTSMPLHLICHQNGIAQGRVERILSLNPQIRNPNFIAGEVVLYE